DHAETITINKSVSGSGLGTAGIVLIGPGGEVFRHMIDLKTGLIPGNETLPSSLSLPPGRYNLGLSVSAQALTNLNSGPLQSALKAGFQVTLSVTAPSSEMHWKNPAGGDFGTASNWDPQRVP